MIDPRRPNFASTPVSPDRPRFQYAPSPLERRERVITPAVSIVTPYFDTGAVMHETAACILGGTAAAHALGHSSPHAAPWRHTPGQSLQNFEWIIVNDGSRDADALRVLDQYRALAQHDPRLRVIDHARNHGLPAARNTGWRAARAPLIFFLDADDLVEPTTLEKSALHLACNPEFAFVKGYSVGFGAQEYLWSHGFHSSAGMLEQNLVTATTMVRRAVLHDLGGFDESIRRGMEDWEFWLRAAALGHWGETIPEYLDWYRRRDDQHATWDNIAHSDKRDRFLSRIRAAHGHIFEGEFPGPSRAWHMPFAHPPEANSEVGTGKSALFDGLEMPQNPLVKRSQRLLMILPWLRMGGADRFNLDLARFLTTRAGAPVGAEGGPWEVTIATTLPGHPWLPEFAALTPDVFPLDHLARTPHVPALLDHLLASRRPDVVMVSNSQLGYFLTPYLRSRHPGVAFVDFNHMEEPHWQNGGHPRTGAGFQEQLDLSIVVSGHLRRWMSAPPRSADPARIEVCHINADSTTFRPDAAARAEWRAELKIDDRTPVILYAARLCPQKQPMVFARTMELLSGSGIGLPADVAAAAAAGLLGTPPSRSNQTTPSTSAQYQPPQDPRGEAPRTSAGKPMPQPQAQPFVALVAGDGEHYAELESFLHARNLQHRVRMLGSIAAAQMPSLMAAADIFFLPSQWEGIALSIYEAMSAGLCVVGADVGGQSELVTPDTGVLLTFRARAPELEAAAYARTLAALLAGPARVAAIGAAARDRIREHFELDAMGRRMLAHFDTARRLHRERPRQSISPGFARELALQGIEMMRIQELAEELWPYRQKYLELTGASAAHAAARDAEDAARRAEAATELARLERSGTWRAIQLVKGTAPYRLIARARFGKDWRLVDPKEPPEVRLARVRASRAYRVARLLDRSAP